MEGFVAGDKNSVQPVMVQAAQQAGISVAALNYRFVDGKEVVFPAPQHDCARRCSSCVAEPRNGISIQKELHVSVVPQVPALVCGSVSMMTLPTPIAVIRLPVNRHGLWRSERWGAKALMIPSRLNRLSEEELGSTHPCCLSMDYPTKKRHLHRPRKPRSSTMRHPPSPISPQTIRHYS